MNAYETDLLAWRRGYESRLTAEGGWLSVAGLVWLEPGTHLLGSRADADVRLPHGPDLLATLTLQGERVTLEPADGVTLELSGTPAVSGPVPLDTQANSPRYRSGPLSFSVLRRGERVGVRLYDDLRPERRAFSGLRWFPVDPTYRLEATFIPFATPRTVTGTNVLGDPYTAELPGEVTFTLHGHPHRLLPTRAGDSLFFVFRDRTSGAETYAPGRFLSTPLPQEGHLTLDFNRAHNPPCAYTPFATCPLPLPENHLGAAIPAGEQTYSPPT